MCVSDSDRPGTQASENWLRRAWHSPQVSTSARNARGALLRMALPVAGIGRPGRITPLGKARQRVPCRVVGLSEWPPALPIARPGDMTRTLAMTALATDADLGKGRGKSVVRRIIVLAHAGRVALCAHEIPVLVQLGPMQDIVVLDLLVRIEMEPALAAFVLRPAVPGKRESLHAAIGKLNEVLLQRIETEGVFHFKDGKFAVRAVGLDEKFSILAEEA